ncbi:hypothetical protein CU097_008543 [Rhizopus azygosporus]|uniref:Uncharacterized protein n=1 Tax=Rhizopus azygosporus TaxID=86630 RepID=A0A367JP10_RHIAZ|nr:hypothetical protein CU097_008543 [Rhizopus azygosporus]
MTLSDTKPVVIKNIRTYDGAILNTCEQLVNNNKESAKTLCIVDSLSLRPFTILAKYGKEKNVLAHASVIKDLQHNCDFVEINFLRKRKFEEEDNMLCITCTKHVQETLGTLYS